MTAPLVPVVLAVTGGVGLGLVTPAPAWLLWAGAALAGLTVTAAWRDARIVATPAVLLLALLAGWARVDLADPWPPLAGLTAGPAVLEGVVAGAVEAEGARTRFPLLVDARLEGMRRHPAAGQLLVDLYGPGPAPEAGRWVRLPLELRELHPFRNPGNPDPTLRVPRGRLRLFAVGRARALEPLPHRPIPWWLDVRLWIHRLVHAHLPPVSGALFEGVLIGERRQLPATLLADFRAAGVFHILAISGFNVALVCGAAFFLLRLARVPARGAAALTLGILVGFVGIVGGQPSVLRATLMGGLVLAAQLLGRESWTWNALAAAGLTLLALEPGSLADPGLQLSFTATAGLLYLTPPLVRRLLGRGWPRPLAVSVAASAGAQLAVTPVMAAHFGQLSVIGVAANLVVVPLAAAITTLGCLTLLLGLASDTLAHLAFQSLWVLLLALRLAARAFSGVPGALVYVPAPPVGALILAAGALATAPHAATRVARAAVAGCGLLAIVWVGLGFLADGRLHVVVLDVGQGEAIVVQGPQGHALVVDTGGGGPGRADRAERVLLPLLRQRGVRRIAALALTHGDPDHIGGLLSLLEGMPVDEVWVPAGTESAPWQAPIVAAGVPRRALACGARLWLGPLLVTVLHPPPATAAGGPLGVPSRLRGNHQSLVLRLDWGLATAVLTGDAEAAAERQILAAGVPLDATLLKVGHHGSRHGSSPGFLAAVHPRLALLSVGARNAFGHPSPAALARLDDAGAAIARTDLDGAVEAVSDGSQLSIRRWARPAVFETFPLRGAP